MQEHPRSTAVVARNSKYLTLNLISARISVRLYHDFIYATCLTPTPPIFRYWKGKMTVSRKVSTQTASSSIRSVSKEVDIDIPVAKAARLPWLDLSTRFVLANHREYVSTELSLIQQFLNHPMTSAISNNKHFLSLVRLQRPHCVHKAYRGFINCHDYRDVCDVYFSILVVLHSQMRFPDFLSNGTVVIWW